MLIENIGKLKLEDFVKQSQEALESGGMNSTNLILADCARLLFLLETIEFLDIPTMFESIGDPKTNKLGVLESQVETVTKDFRFLETVFQNRF